MTTPVDPPSLNSETLDTFIYWRLSLLLNNPFTSDFHNGRRDWNIYMIFGQRLL